MSGLHVLATLGLTLPELADDDVERIRDAAGPDTRVTVVAHWRDGIDVADDVDVIFGVAPPKLFAAAPALRWVHATASGVDMFMYPEFVESDVVLTEIRLRLRDGWHLCEALRDGPATAHIPVCIFTATVLEFARDRSLAAGADCFVAKPIRPSELVERVADLLGPSAGEGGAGG